MGRREKSTIWLRSRVRWVSAQATTDIVQYYVVPGREGTFWFLGGFVYFGQYLLPLVNRSGDAGNSKEARKKDKEKEKEKAAKDKGRKRRKALETAAEEGQEEAEQQQQEEEWQ